MSSEVASLVESLAAGTVEIVDLTQPLSESTPVIQLPPQFANTPHLSRTELSHYNDARPGLGLVGADARRAHRHPPRRADPLDHRSGRQRCRVAAAVAADRPGLRDRQDRRDRSRPGYLLTAPDIEEWEAEHGLIPDRAWVLLRTGWGSRAQDEAEFLNASSGMPVTPGPDVGASQWLARERGLSGFGVETVGIDAGAAGGFDPPFPVHNLLLGAGRLGLTQLANLDRLPATGALIVVSPLKLVGGTGSPSRVFAFVPR